MITTNPMQLKAFIKKKAAEKNISAQLVMQNYMMERLRRWTKGYTIKQPNMDCQPTEITALMRHRAVFS